MEQLKKSKSVQQTAFSAIIDEQAGVYFAGKVVFWYEVLAAILSPSSFDNGVIFIAFAS